MNCKTLLTLVTALDDPAVTHSLLDAAVAYARREDAHLEVLAVGIDDSQLGYFYGGASMMVMQETFGRAEASSVDVETLVRNRLNGEDIRWSVDRAITQLGALSMLVASRARYADLVMLPLPYGAGGGQAGEAALEAALFEADVPVLVLPRGLTEAPVFERIVVAWNDSPEALASVRQALPLLKAAREVSIVVIDPPAYGLDQPEPGTLLSQWLARHGVRGEISVLAKTLPRVSEVMLRHLREQEADLLVMGAYGHSRFRQAILGGATRDMLENATTPVFMAR